MTNICIFASGNGTNAEAIIDHFSDSSEVAVQLIISSRNDAFVLQRAKNHQIRSLVLDKSKFKGTAEILDDLNNYGIDFIALAGFMWLVPAYLIKAFPNKIVNIHPALLPKFGGKGMYGSHVHDAVIAAGEVKSGITIHYVNENYDEGAIITREVCPVTSKDTAASLAEKIHELEHQHYARVIEELIIG